MANESTDGAGFKAYTRAGAFVSEVESFDSSFFGIPAMEARVMDPKQRLMLEVGYEALHSAGYASLREMRGANVGVLVGVCSNDWPIVSARMPGRINSFTGTGDGPSIHANRLSYALGLTGPSLMLDTGGRLVDER